MLKFRRFLAHQRGQIENKTTPYEFKRDTQGLPAWLVNELERFQHVQQRNWREARLDQQIRSFWIVHLRVWRFLREQYGVRELADVKRKHLLDFTDQRLKDEYAASTINTDLRTFQGFLKFLQQEGYAIPQSLLGHKSVPTYRHMILFSKLEIGSVNFRNSFVGCILISYPASAI